MLDLGLKDAHVLITGAGASGGIGLEIVKVFLGGQGLIKSRLALIPYICFAVDQGAKVTAQYNTSPATLNALAAEQGSSKLHIAQADLSSESSVQSLFKSAVDTLGPVHIAAINHGNWVEKDVMLKDMSLERWNFTMDANLTSAFLVAREFIKGVENTLKAVNVAETEKERLEQSSVVFVGSTAGQFGEANHSDYAAAKSGRPPLAIMYGLTLSLKNEIVKVAPRGRVNCVAPGWTHTPKKTESLSNAETVYRITATLPLRKVATTYDIAIQIALLSSAKVSGHVTGHVVDVAGGMEEFLQGSSTDRLGLVDGEDYEYEDDEEESQSDSDGEDEDGEEDDSDDEEAEADQGSMEEGANEGLKEIEGDFDRLVSDIRERNDNSLSRDWDINIEEQEETFRDDLRAASGIGRRKGKNVAIQKGPRTRATGPVLSHQVKALLGDGNQAFVDGDSQTAIKVMQEVIRIEPRAAGAWTVLAQCYEELGQHDKALQLRIMAAHLKFDAEEWAWLARQSKDLGFHQQALYCYRKVYSLDPANVDALWDRAVLAKEIGDLRIARHSFLAILKRIPHDLTVLSELRPILIELGDFQICARLFQDAFDHYQKQFPTGKAEGEGSEAMEGGGFGLLNILVLADLYNTLEEYDKAATAIRVGCRWLQGRAEQKYWEMIEDDREYDVEGMPSRQAQGAEEGREGGRYPLDVNARHRLAIARIKMSETEEGIRHANVVLSEEVLDYAPLFVEIADAYFEREMYAEAKPVYEMLGTDPNTAACLRVLGELKEAAEIYEHVRTADPTNNDAKMKLAEIYEIIGETRKALDLVYQVIDSRKRRPKAQQASTPVPSLPTNSLFSEERAKTSTKTGKTRENRLTPAQLRELEAQKEKEVMKSYARLKEIWEGMLEEHEKAESSRLSAPSEGTWVMTDQAEEGPLEKEWMMEAEKLVETFRETRNLFLASRITFFRGMFPKKRSGGKKQNEEESEERMASRLQLDLENESTGRSRTKFDGVDDFRGVSFNEWLHVILQYCFVLTKRRQYEVADEILRHVLISNAYLSPQYQVTIRLALTACAIHSNHPQVIVEQIRKLISTNQFNNEMYRLLMASLSSGLKPTDSFITSTLQKFLFREMKLADAAVNNPETVRWNPMNKRWAPILGGQWKKGGAEEGDDGDDEDGQGTTASGVQTATEDGKTPLPTKNNPLIVAIYGQMCIAAKSYQSAICESLLLRNLARRRTY
ncbi:transcription factor TFIIIC subunit tfc4 [Marasmius crinis-equi]|uniref:Transcription factor TFIIIC subunit tfc4 n=1 Tax=Marasmius crinis-equi TaxID=585013 RepID=A0ABR3FPL2_9AGAR